MSARIFDDSSKQRIEAIVYGTLKILPYENDILFQYERIGEGTFDNMKIGAVNRPPATLVVNIDWYENAQDESDIKLILRHESRHLYQWSQIKRWQDGKEILEKPETVERWARNYSPGNYITNTPGQEIQYFQQPVELDAYVFTIFLMNIEQFDPDEFVIKNVDYPGIGDAVFDSVVKMFQTTPLKTLLLYRDHFRSQQV